jgi:hypothetical protein
LWHGGMSLRRRFEASLFSPLALIASSEKQARMYYTESLSRCLFDSETG